MTNIKKAYQEIYAILEANKGKKVSTILEQLLPLMEAKTNSTTFLKDENDNVIAIYCYYHKRWELVDAIEYGKKASNKSTGLNTMCKEGMRLWSKQQRVIQNVKSDLLDQLANGEIEASEIGEKQVLAEEQAREIQTSDAILANSFETLEELNDYLANQ